MTAVYDDNFGFWDINQPEEQAFFEQVQSQSVPTIVVAANGPFV
jgi:hypothetical protein